MATTANRPGGGNEVCQVAGCPQSGVMTGCQEAPSAWRCMSTAVPVHSAAGRRSRAGSSRSARTTGGRASAYTELFSFSHARSGLILRHYCPFSLIIARLARIPVPPLGQRLEASGSLLPGRPTPPAPGTPHPLVTNAPAIMAHLAITQP